MNKNIRNPHTLFTKITGQTARPFGLKNRIHAFHESVKRGFNKALENPVPKSALEK
jgi:hypothetical protein